MRYQYLTHDKIDFAKRDECIVASANGNIYSLSWYLNIVSPRWDGLVEIKDGEYTKVIALPIFKKFKLMTFLRQPHFVNQLGIISRQPTSGAEFAEMLNLLRSTFSYISQYPLNLSNQLLVDGLE